MSTVYKYDEQYLELAEAFIEGNKNCLTNGFLKYNLALVFSRFHNTKNDKINVKELMKSSDNYLQEAI